MPYVPYILFNCVYINYVPMHKLELNVFFFFFRKFKLPDLIGWTVINC